MDETHLPLPVARSQARGRALLLASLLSLAAVAFCCAYTLDGVAPVEQQMLAASDSSSSSSSSKSVTLESKGDDSECDSTGACRKVEKFDKGPELAAEEAAEKKAKALMRKHTKALKRYKDMKAQAKSDEELALDLEKSAEKLRLHKMTVIYAYRALRRKDQELDAWYKVLKTQTEEDNEAWRSANNKYDKMEEAMDEDKSKYKARYAQLFDLAREIDDDDATDRDAGLIVDFATTKRILKQRRDTLTEEVEDATLFEKRLEELKVTEDDRESKKDQIRAILKGWTGKKHGLFEDLRKTCKKHKEAVKAWKQQVAVWKASKIAARRLRTEARRYKQAARRALDSVKKEWPKLATTAMASTDAL